MDRTTPVSNGWMTFVRPLGTIFPLADATMSSVPTEAQISATQKRNIMVTPIARPIGDGGVSATSSAAGRNASSSPPCARNELARRLVNLAIPAALADLTALADLMNTCLQAVQRRISATSLDQRIMRAVLNQTAAIERDDAIRRAHG